MKYLNQYKERNESVSERYELIKERILNIKEERHATAASYFAQNAAFIERIFSLYEQVEAGIYFQKSEHELQQDNENLYADIMPGRYESSFANPAYAASQFGNEAGSILSFLQAQLRCMISYAFEQKKAYLTIYAELFVEIYNQFEEKEPDLDEVRQSIFWFFHDYIEWFVEDGVASNIDANQDFFTEIVMQEDLSDLSYLYRYGSYIGENERQMAAYMNKLPDETIQKMADTFTEGYRIGFEVTGKDLSKKDAAMIYYPIGFERMVRRAILNLEELGLKTTVFRERISSHEGIRLSKNGCYSCSPNPQYDYDHQFDMGMYFNKSFAKRRLEVLKTAYENQKELAAKMAGPAVIEIFGEEPFTPKATPERITFTKEQHDEHVAYQSEASRIVNDYIIGSERSYTIIAFPIPEIGERFEDIFHETIKINTLDYKTYLAIQQKIVDELNQAQKVRITGQGNNHTNLTVSIYKLDDPKTQTAFENCVADVNIPVGEVFTSPVLKGTTGLLQVSEVYLNGLRYENLSVEFEDGMTKALSCTNFEDETDNRKFLKENLLFGHEQLPMGEFAIGTNTIAYRMGKDYNIFDRLPILIAEKTGPHFAIGDTCYSYAEDVRVYNADGKEIMAKDNEVSARRKEDPLAAYFNCHTDITIPFEELGAITVIRADGSQIDIIRDGLFVVPGTEALNEPLGGQ
ncbi:MAG: aminopeptidase [Eubacterium sp.]|nr:aminopeptidase [Eubacterium sp.]